jgi:hypothetical protein
MTARQRHDPWPGSTAWTRSGWKRRCPKRKPPAATRCERDRPTGRRTGHRPLHWQASSRYLPAGRRRKARTVRVRLEFPNPDGRNCGPASSPRCQFLTPATRRTPADCPAEALIRSGRRTRVILAADHGRFQPVDRERRARKPTAAARSCPGSTPKAIRVVASGQFLMDSEAGLQGVLARGWDRRLPDDKPAPRASAGIEPTASSTAGSAPVKSPCRTTPSRRWAGRP